MFKIPSWFISAVKNSSSVGIVLFNDSVGIGEHTDILAEVSKWVDSLSQAEENLTTLDEYYGEE